MLEVTNQNFWDMHNKYESETLKKYSKSLRTITLFSFLKYITLELIYALIVAPSTFVFALFLLTVYNIGFEQALFEISNNLNTLIVSNTVAFSNSIFSVWLAFSIYIFLLRCVIFKWESPAAKKTKELMEKWWLAHGHLYVRNYQEKVL